MGGGGAQSGPTLSSHKLHATIMKKRVAARVKEEKEEEDEEEGG